MELLVRVVATAAIVIGITVAVERLGAAIGGALAGLPIVIGPGFFFIARDHSAAFTAEAATASLLSLCATETFLLGYAAAAGRCRPALALGLATLGWFSVAMLLSQVPPSPPLALALFLVAAVLARRLGRRFLRESARRRVPGGPGLLLARGLAAGILVAAATLTASRLGADWSGFIVTYPIGLSVVAVTLHQRAGAGTVVATLHAAMLGVASLAAFSLTLASLIEAGGALPSLLAAFVASVAVTSALAWRARAPVTPAG